MLTIYVPVATKTVITCSLACQAVPLKVKRDFEQSLASVLTNLNNCPSFEAVDRVSETQQMLEIVSP